MYFDADGNAVSDEPTELADFRVKSGSEDDGTAEYYSLKDVYDGIITMEQLVSGMTINELANFVEGGNKSPNGNGQSAGGVSPDSLKASESTIKMIDDNFVRGDAGETNGLYIENRLIPNISLADGPAKLRIDQTYEDQGTSYYQFCTAFPIGTLLAQSWDLDVVYRMGQAVGEEMAEYGVTLWLAPGMNIHRSPLCGRNFEYYSEDPVLNGLIAASEGSGVQSNPGIGVTYKHFAGNNQETSRNAQNNVVSERALREVYLKGFEIAVKVARPMAVMTSYNINNSVSAANDYDLCTNLLRKEWGFDGLVMTDWGGSGGYSDARAMHAGNDSIMAGRAIEAIVGYISDSAPVINYDENGIATDGGYPVTTASTMTFGTFIFNSVASQWGDYAPAAGGTAFEVITTTEAIDNKTVPVQVSLGGQGWFAPSEIQYWTIREVLDGKDGNDGNHLNGMVENNTATYEENDGTVTITYYLERISARDNISTGHQNPSTTDILGNPDENTLTLGDLQKSVINILNVVMASSQFADLTGIDCQSYTEARADQIINFVDVIKLEVK